MAAPTATPTLRTGLMLMYMALRNKIAAKLLTDDGSDYTEAEMS